MAYLDDVRKEALARCPALLHEWLPDGRQFGHYYKCASISGGKGDSFTVNSQTGQWADWAGPADHRGGDLISLYAAIKGVSYKESLALLASFFGVKRQKRNVSKPGEWNAITPMPASALEIGSDGVPLLPKVGKLPSECSRYWIYTDAAGAVLMFVARYDPPNERKFFRPITFWRHKDGATEWRTQALPAPRPLYNLVGLAASPSKILLVEGEKAADAAIRLLPDWCVITWPGGAQNVRYADWNALRDALKGGTVRICLWPDNDTPGEEAMSAVAAQLPCDVEVIARDPRWAQGYDLADLETDGWTTAQVEDWIASHAMRVQKPKARERVEVRLDGNDAFEHMNALLEAIRRSEAPIFNTVDGVSVVRKNIYGVPHLRGLDAETLSASIVPYIAPKKWHPAAGREVDAKVTTDLARIVLENTNGHLPVVEATYATPIWAEGGLVDKSGYSKHARAWLEIPKDYDPEMAVEDAVGLWEDFVGDFPFQSESDKTAALAFALTPILRPSIDGPVPLFRFEAPAQRTGKSLLCSCIAEIVTPNIGMSALTDDEEETRKAITTLLLQSSPIHVFDNAERLETMALKRLLTSRQWTDRILGKNREVTLPIRTVFAATLNNPVMSLEILGRSVRIRLDSKMESPETRSGWRHPDLITYVRKNRAKLVSALCAIIREGSGYSPSSYPVLGAYEDWIHALAPILEVNGYSDFLGSLAEDKEMSVDPGREALREFVLSWAKEFGPKYVTSKDLTQIASDCVGFPAKRSTEGRISADSVGRCLTKMRGAIVGGFSVVKGHLVGHTASWRLVGDFSDLQNQTQASMFDEAGS